MSNTETDQTQNGQPNEEGTESQAQSDALAAKDAEIESLKAQLSAASSAPTAPAPATPGPSSPTAPPVSPTDGAVSVTQFDGLTVSVRRNTDRDLWQAYLTFGGVEWVFAQRNLGGLDDDLQEAATPGFKERRREYYEREQLGLR